MLGELSGTVSFPSMYCTFYFDLNMIISDFNEEINDVLFKFVHIDDE